MMESVSATQKRLLQPLAVELFPDEAELFDAHHSFIVQYPMTSIYSKI